MRTFRQLSRITGNRILMESVPPHLMENYKNSLISIKEFCEEILAEAEKRQARKRNFK